MPAGHADSGRPHRRGLWHLTRLVGSVPVYSELVCDPCRDGLRRADPALRPTPYFADGAVVDGHQHFPDFDRLHLAVSGERRPARNGGRIDAGEFADPGARVSAAARTLVFSVKQTGVPVGSLIGGLMIPFLLGTVLYSATVGTTIRLGTYGAAFVTAVIVVAVALMLQPIRDYFDAERKPDTKLSFGDLSQTMRMVLDNPPVRDIAFAAFAFGGLQSLFAGFFILYLIDGLNYSEAQSGSIYAIASFSAIFARIAWGVGGGVISPRLILGLIGLTGALSALGLTQISASWTVFEVTVIAVLYNMTAISWHGILLAEIARLAPKEQVGAVTGGVLSFTSVAMMIYPAIYGFLLATTGSYRVGFLLGAIPSFAAFLIFIRAPVQGPWGTALASSIRDQLQWRPALIATMVLTTGMAIGWMTYWN